jgi:hypothetical protein
VGSFAASPWQDSDKNRVKKKKGKKVKKRGKPNKITICHRPPGNSENEHEITISERVWPAHKKHGDKKGSCSFLTRTKTYSLKNSSNRIKNFRLNQNGELGLVVTKTDIRFFEQGEVIKTIQSRGTVRTSISDELYVADCTRTCHLYNANGTKVGSASIKGFPYPGTLVGTKMVLTGGPDMGYKASIRNLNTGETIWSSPNGDFARFGNETSDYFFLRKNVRDGVTHQLIKTRTGAFKGQVKKHATMIGISGNNNFFYFATDNQNKSAETTKSIQIYDFNLNKVVEWNGYSKIGMYRGQFFEDLNQLIIPLEISNSLFLGNYQTLSQDTVPYPHPFAPKKVHHDEDDNLLFISGVKTGYHNFANGNYKVDREILIFDANEGRFKGTSITLNFSEIISKESKLNLRKKYFVPELNGRPNENKLIINLGKLVRIYEY